MGMQKAPLTVFMLLLLLLAPSVNSVFYPFEVELGNVSSYGDILGMWQNATLYGVYHGKNATLYNSAKGIAETLTGTPTTATGIYGDGYQTDGSVFGQVSTSGLVNTSVCAWVQRITGTNVRPYGFNGEEGLYLEDGSQNFVIYKSAGGYVEIRKSAPPNVWNFVCYSKIGATSTIYVNASAGTTSDLLNANTFTYYTVFRGEVPGGTGDWNGYSDEYRFFNKSLSQSEINEQYQNAINTPGYGSLEAGVSNNYTNGYATCARINCTNVATSTPIAINGSAGATIGGDKQIIWAECAPVRYLCYDNSTSYAITDDINLTPSAANLNITLNSPNDLYTSANRSLIFNYTTRFTDYAEVITQLYINGVMMANDTATENTTYAVPYTAEYAAYSWYVFAYNASDITQNATSATRTFTIYYTLNATQNTPAGDYYTLNKTIAFNYEVNSTLPNFTSILYLDGAVLANNSATENTTYNINTITTYGIHSWYIYTYDTANASRNNTTAAQNFTIYFNATALIPTNNAILEGNGTVLYYQVNNLYPINCTTYLDATAIDNQIVPTAATIGVFTYAGLGSHSWYASCIAGDNASYVITSNTLIFSMNYSSFNYLLNLSSVPQNVFSQPQLLFYDIEGYLNVLYFTDEVAGNTLNVKKINGTDILTNYSMLYEDTPLIFAIALRETDKTVIYGLTTAAPSTSLIITLYTNGTITAATGSFPYANVLKTNNYYDAYTYAGTAHIQTLNLTARSQYFTMVPMANGSGYFTINATDNNISQVGAQLTGNIAAAWQTLANNTELTEWYYLGTGGENIRLEYYNGTRNQLIELDAGYTAAELNASIGNFYEYGGKKYVVLANLTKTTIYQIDGGINYNFTEKLANPSFLYFVDADTFLFFNTVGATTDAYSCYFTTVGNCTKLSATEYGFNMPYERGRMATMKRESTSDVVAKGVISSGTTTTLLYNQYTYDGKYLCYDEMAETRKLFKVNVYTNTTANQLINNSWGYIIPSSILGEGTKKAYFTCWNGTQRLFIAGLNNNYTINAYSLEVPKGVYYTFQALNQYNIPVQGAIITAYRFAPSVAAFVPIEQGISDFNGNAIFYLEPYQFYKFVVEAGGYVVLTFDLTPGADTVLEFKLSQTGGTILNIPTYERIFNDVSYSILPISNYQNESFNITYTIASANSELQYYGMNISREFNGTTTQVYNATGTAAGGGVLQYTATLNGTYRVDTWFKHQNYTLYQPPQVSYFLSVKQGLGKVKDLLPGLMGGWAYFMVAVAVSLIVAGYISRFTIDGAGVMGLMVLWFFTAMNPGAVIMGAAGCSLGTIGCITIVMATALTSVIVMAGLICKQFG